MAKSILKYTIHSSLAKTLLNEVLSKTSKYYYTFGKTTSWGSPDTPPDILDTLESEYSSRRNIVLCREVLSNDVTLVIDRINWVSGQIYDQYDAYSETNISYSGATSLDTAIFYVLTDEFNVYKCISNNNNSASTVRPTGQPTGTISDPADGYVWKYMYSIPLFLRNKFLSSSQMPVLNALQQSYYSDGNIAKVVLDNKGSLYYVNTSLGSVVSKFEGGVQNLRYVYGTDIAINSLVSGDRFEVNGEVRTVSSVTTTTIDSILYYRITILATEPLLIIDNFSPAKKLNTELVITGDGNKATNPYQLKSILVSDGGSGYSSSNNIQITFPTPYLDGEPAQATAVVNIDLTGITKTNSGSAYVSAPSATFSGGGGSGAAVTTILGFPIKSITRTQAGSNYSETPTVTIVGDATTDATAAAVLSGSVSLIQVASGGTAYATAPAVTVGVEWQAETAYTNGNQIFYSNRLYTIVGSGISGTVAPTHTTGTEVNGNISLEYVGVAATATSVISGGIVTQFNITQAGSGYSSAPSITVAGGGGATASASAKISAGIGKFVVTSIGSGYTSIPSVLITPNVVDTNVNSGAGEAVLSNNGSVKTMTLSGLGSNYTSAPSVTFSAPFFTALAANVNATTNIITSSAVHNMSTADPVRYTTSGTVIGGLTASTIYYIIKISDTEFKLALDGGDATAGTAIDISTTGTGTHTFTSTDVAKIASGTIVATTGYIKSITLTNPGYGYNIIPTPIISDSSNPAGTGIVAAAISTVVEKTKAYIEPVIDSSTGQIISVYIKDGGNGYTAASVEVKRNKINPSSGKITAAVSVDVNPGNTSSQQSLVERTAVNGSIDNIQLLNGGSDYSAVTVTITGDGTGTAGLNTKATATATIVDGVITKINIIDRGKDYTIATINITPNAGTGGSGASAKVIISPPGGHGKSAIDEFFGRTVLMYSRLPVTPVKGITLSSSYRQVSILKNPKIFNSPYYYNGFSGSTCYKVTLSTTPTVTLTGTTVDVYDKSTVGAATRSATFTVIGQSGNSLVLQAIDNDDEIMISNYYLRDRVSGSGAYYLISFVEKPEIDRFSGEMLFVDNKPAFLPTAEQPVIVTSRFKL